MCEHKLDEMGCNFVMPGNYDFNGTLCVFLILPVLSTKIF